MTPRSTHLNAFQYIWRSPWIRVIVFLLAGYLILRGFGLVKSIVIDFGIAYLIAYLANPVLNWLERHRIKRGLGVFFVLLLISGLFVIAGSLTFTIAGELVLLLRNLPDQINNLDGILSNVLAWLSERGVPGINDAQTRITAAVQEWLQNLDKNLAPILQNAINTSGTLVTGLRSIGGVIGRILLIVLLSIYLMLDYSRVNASFLRAFPLTWQPRIIELGSLVGLAVGGYVRGQLLIATFIGVFVWIGLTILGIPSAAAIAFLAGAFNVVPYLGPIIGALPALLLALPMGWLFMLGVVLVFVLANLIEGNFLSPYILSRTTDLHPVTVLLAILIGVALMGFSGALLSVPVVALCKVLLEKYYFTSRIYTDGP